MRVCARDKVRKTRCIYHLVEIDKGTWQVKKNEDLLRTGEIDPVQLVRARVPKLLTLSIDASGTYTCVVERAGNTRRKDKRGKGPR